MKEYYASYNICIKFNGISLLDKLRIFTSLALDFNSFNIILKVFNLKKYITRATHTGRILF